MPFKPGTLYNPGAMAELNSRLAETRLFALSRAQLADQPTGQNDRGDAIHDIDFAITERERNTARFGVSYSTADGYGFTSDFLRRNATRRGDSLEATLNLAQLDRSVEFKWNRPNEFGYGRGLILSSEISDETTDAFDRFSTKLGAGVEMIEDDAHSWTFGIGVEATNEKGPSGERNIQLSSVYLSGRLDRTDNVLDPSTGWRADARIVPTFVFGDADSQYLRSVAQIRGYKSLGRNDNIILAGRLRSGNLLGAIIEDVPSNERFFAGGGGSVRGYSYQAIGPLDNQGNSIGGRALLETSVEARWQSTKRYGFAAFLDSGAVSSSQHPTFNNMRHGAGIGVRYATPAGPLRLDIAAPLDPRESDDPVQVYISIGQAF